MFVVVVLKVGHPRQYLFGGIKIEKLSEIVLTPAPVVGLRNGHLTFSTIHLLQFQPLPLLIL